MNIKVYSYKEGIKVKDLAKKFGISVNYISMLNTKKRKPSKKLAKKIVEITEGKVTLDELLA